MLSITPPLPPGSLSRILLDKGTNYACRRLPACRCLAQACDYDARLEAGGYRYGWFIWANAGLQSPSNPRPTVSSCCVTHGCLVPGTWYLVSGACLCLMCHDLKEYSLPFFHNCFLVWLLTVKHCVIAACLLPSNKMAQKTFIPLGEYNVGPSTPNHDVNTRVTQHHPSCAHRSSVLHRLTQ